MIQEEKRLNFRSQVFKERRRTRDPEDVESPRWEARRPREWVPVPCKFGNSKMLELWLAASFFSQESEAGYRLRGWRWMACGAGEGIGEEV